MQITQATKSDLDALCDVYMNAFLADEAPLVAGLICDLTTQKTTPETLSLVYKQDGEIVGSIGISPVYARDLTAYILAPLAVHSMYQKQGIGSQLIAHAKHYLAGQGVDVLLVYGDPAYYKRYGFEADIGAYFTPPYPLEYDFGWQGVWLSDVLMSDVLVSQEKYAITCVPALMDEKYW